MGKHLNIPLCLLWVSLQHLHDLLHPGITQSALHLWITQQRLHTLSCSCMRWGQGMGDKHARMRYGFRGEHGRLSLLTSVTHILKLLHFYKLTWAVTPFSGICHRQWGRITRILQTPCTSA